MTSPVLLGFGRSPAVVKAVHLLELQLGAIPLSLKLIYKYFSGVFSKMVSDFQILSFKGTKMGIIFIQGVTHRAVRMHCRYSNKMSSQLATG